MHSLGLGNATTAAIFWISFQDEAPTYERYNTGLGTAEP